MKFEELNVFSKDEKTNIKKVNKKDIKSTNDVLLNSTLNSYDEQSRPYIEKTLHGNPLFIKFNEDCPIKSLEQFIIEYKGNEYSIGGLIMNSQLSSGYKKKVLKRYFKDISKEYNESIKNQEVNVSNITTISDAYEPKYVKFKRILTYTIIGAFMFFMFFVFSKIEFLANFVLTGWLVDLLNSGFNKKIPNILRYITFGLWCLQILVFIIMNIITKIVKHRYDGFSKSTSRYIRKIKHNANKKVRKLRNFYLKQIKYFKKHNTIKEFNLEKYDMSKLNVDNIKEVCDKNVAHMAKIIKRQKKFYKTKIIWHLLATISFIALIALMIFSK